MIVVCGEALIDFTPASFGDTQAYVPRPGGSPYNVAIGLGRLETPVAFLGRLSTDAFGRMLGSHLVENGVNGRFLRTGDEPTTLAFVHLREGHEPEFSFYGEGAADRSLLPQDLPASFDDEVRAIHFGSYSLAVEPIGSTLAQLARREHGRRVISLDPNVRPSLIPDRQAYMSRLEELVSLASLVKASKADLEWLYPNESDIEKIAERWLELGLALVVVTLGDEGAAAYTRSHRATFKAVPVQVVDTVGAGDAFMSGLLASLHAGLLDNERLTRLRRTDLIRTLRYANIVAALTCARAGADTPTLEEVESRERRRIV